MKLLMLACYSLQSYVPIDGQGKRCFLRMTPDSVSPRASSAFLDFRFNPQNTEKSFSMSIGYRIYGGKSRLLDPSQESDRYLLLELETNF